MTRVDKIVTAGVLVVLGLAMLPAIGADNGGIGRQRELSNRVYCAANLKGLATSLCVYGNDNGDQFPILTATSATTYDVNGYKLDEGKATQDDTISELYSDKKHMNDPLAGMWLLVLTNHVTPKMFICRSDPFASKPAASITKEGGNSYTDFQDGTNFSYSMAYPWIKDERGKVSVGPQWRNTTDSSLPIISDMAPYLGSKAKEGEFSGNAEGKAPGTLVAAAGTQPSTEAAWSSMNHQHEGQNVAYGDAHVEFDRRADVGQNAENIWMESVDDKETLIEAGTLPAALTAESAPLDVVMVPTRSAKGELK